MRRVQDVWETLNNLSILTATAWVCPKCCVRLVVKIRLYIMHARLGSWIEDAHSTRSRRARARQASRNSWIRKACTKLTRNAHCRNSRVKFTKTSKIAQWHCLPTLMLWLSLKETVCNRRLRVHSHNRRSCSWVSWNGVRRVWKVWSSLGRNYRLIKLRWAFLIKGNGASFHSRLRPS